MLGFHIELPESARRKVSQIEGDDHCCAATDLPRRTRHKAKGLQKPPLRIQGLVFPRAVGRGKNLIVYFEQCPAGALELHNAAELMKKMRQILRKPK
jgi:hypothetical protein